MTPPEPYEFFRGFLSGLNGVLGVGQGNWPKGLTLCHSILEVHM